MKNRIIICKNEVSGDFWYTISASHSANINQNSQNGFLIFQQLLLFTGWSQNFNFWACCNN